MPVQLPTECDKLLKKQEEAVLGELELVRASVPFRSSRRFSLMLEHCVRTTLSGDIERLRERQLGVDVFAREPGYETSADPVVRMAAGEVRKRLAQYYGSLEHAPAVRISLPLGGYSAEFRFAETEKQLPGDEAAPASASAETGPAESHTTVLPVARPPLIDRSRLYWLAGSVLLISVSLAGYLHRRALVVSPFLRGMSVSGSTIAILGQLPQVDAARPAPIPLSEDIFRSEDAVTIEGATTAVAVCSELARSGGGCTLKQVARINLSDLQHRPAILFGAYNNSWTLRLTQDLPFRFGSLECKCILERGTERLVGRVDFSLPREKIFVDYSVVARFTSHVTDGPVLIVAGVGPMSTQAAAEFISSPDGVSDTLRLAPKNWKDGNFELILGTDVVEGVPGHTRVVRSSFW